MESSSREPPGFEPWRRGDAGPTDPDNSWSLPNALDPGAVRDDDRGFECNLASRTDCSLARPRRASITAFCLACYAALRYALTGRERLPAAHARRPADDQLK